MTRFACPNCGNSIEPELRIVKMTNCDSCGTTLFLDDEVAQMAGDAGVMHETPMLFGLNDTVQFPRSTVTIKGHARFSYGRGFWDEFWGLTSNGASIWVSVDEGDIVLQKAMAEKDWPRNVSRKIGSFITHRCIVFTITEVESAHCVAVRGSFDEQLHVGDTYQFLNAQSEAGKVLSAEFWGSGESWFIGDWVDPFDAVVQVNP